MTTLDIAAKDGGRFSAYIAMPKQTPAPTIVVIQEIFGVNQGLRDKCEWLASEGFIAVCPDLFWRIEPGIELTDQTDEEWKRAFELFNTFDVDLGIEDISATIHAMRGHADSTGKVGCLGYCLGGKLAYLTACLTNINASIGYYGVGIEDLLGDSKGIQNPLMLHIAEEDEYVSKDAQDKITAGLQGNDLVTLHSYPGMNHAFTREGGAHYDAENAKLADERSITFLKQALS